MARSKRGPGHWSGPKKRKFDEDGEEVTAKPGEKSSTSKKQKKNGQTDLPERKASSGPVKVRDIAHDESIAMKDPTLLADLFAHKVAKHYSDSSTIEQQDIGIRKAWLEDTTDFEPPHTAENLPAFLEKFVDGGKDSLSTSETEATPHTIVITSSGIRVADLIRELRVFNSADSKVAKLIAKKMKLKDNAEYLAKTKVGIVVVTPARVRDLIEQDAIQIDALKSVVIDASYLDEKKRSITDMVELFKPLLQVLHHEKVEQRLEGGDGANILVF